MVDATLTNLGTNIGYVVGLLFHYDIFFKVYFLLISAVYKITLSFHYLIIYFFARFSIRFAKTVFAT